MSLRRVCTIALIAGLAVPSAALAQDDLSGYTNTTTTPTTPTTSTPSTTPTTPTESTTPTTTSQAADPSTSTGNGDVADTTTSGGNSAAAPSQSTGTTGALPSALAYTGSNPIIVALIGLSLVLLAGGWQLRRRGAVGR